MQFYMLVFIFLSITFLIKINPKSLQIIRLILLVIYALLFLILFLSIEFVIIFSDQFFSLCFPQQFKMSFFLCYFPLIFYTLIEELTKPCQVGYSSHKPFLIRKKLWYLVALCLRLPCNIIWFLLAPTYSNKPKQYC